jgi:hypothetical protein
MLTVTLVTIAAAVGLLLLYVMQPGMVFQPWAELVMTPDAVGLVFEDIRIPVADHESIHAWYFPAKQAEVTVLFCHGNAGNISHRLETAAFLVDQHCNALIFDYRGYGISDGTPSEENVYRDAAAAYAWLTTEKGVPAEQIVIMGRSLGGAVAVDLAARVNCRALILESTFSSAADMARELFPFLPVHLLLRFQFDSVSKIGKVSVPILMVHSPDDEIVPFAFGRKLFAAAPEPKSFVEISGGHNERDYLQDFGYQAAFRTAIGAE